MLSLSLASYLFVSPSLSRRLRAGTRALRLVGARSHVRGITRLSTGSVGPRKSWSAAWSGAVAVGGSGGGGGCRCEARGPSPFLVVYVVLRPSRSCTPSHSLRLRSSHALSLSARLDGGGIKLADADPRGRALLREKTPHRGHWVGREREMADGTASQQTYTVVAITRGTRITMGDTERALPPEVAVSLRSVLRAAAGDAAVGFAKVTAR